MDKKAVVNLGLESLAVALIVSPEPVTTVLGISLLSYTRLNNRQQEIRRNRPLRSFNDQYKYKMNIVNRNTINYNVYTTKPGQLPAWSNMARLCGRPEVWQSYKTDPLRKNQVYNLRLQPAGLLGAPGSKSSYKFMAPKKPQNQK